MPLEPGTTLGPYVIEAAVGAGGMGDVYRARDPRLDRVVAIKLINESLGDDPESRARFEREARAVAALSHPHICVVHDVGRHGPIDFLVMEYLDGETLAQRLARGRLPLKQAVEYARQIGDALDKAHHAGIIHRDLKPANIILTRTGAKLLDFGLAKPRPAGPAAMSAAMTQVPPITGQGTILGTLQYMAPEQVEGREADVRSDIWSFGCVVYEMVAGRPAFGGTSQASVIAAILDQEPVPVSSVQPIAPRALDAVIARCLTKSPDDRWQSVRDVLHALALVETAALSLHDVPSRGLRPRALRWAPAAVATALAVAAIAFAMRKPAAEPALPVQFSVAPPPGTRFDWAFTPNSSPPAVSPDGRSVVFGAVDASANTTLWIRRLDTIELRQLAGTDGAIAPFWSPDSRMIAFFSGTALKVVNAAGGPVRTLCSAAAGRGGAWSRDNTIVFADGTSGGLKRISADGGPVAAVTTLDSAFSETAHRWPVFLPDGRHFIYSAGRFGPAVDMSENTLYVGDSASPARSPVEKVNSSAAYDRRGFLLYVRDYTLMAVPFDAETGKTRGAAQSIVEGVARYGTSGRSMFSVSENGVLAYHPATAPSTELRWTNATGAPGALVDTLHAFVAYRISPDGKRIAVALPDVRRGESDIWIYEAGGRRKLTFDMNCGAPIWSHDGSRVLFVVQRGDTASVYEKPADGSTPQQEIGKIKAVATLEDVSPDGRTLAYATFDLKTQYDLWTADIKALDRARPFATGNASSERQGRFSPDGRWLAYHSNETGRYEVYVQPFPPTGARWQVSTAGGAGPQWTADGKRMFFQTPDLFVTAVDVHAGAAFATGPPQKMFKLSEIPYPREGGAGFFELGPDGSILWQSPITSGAAPLVILTDWLSALKR